MTKFEELQAQHQALLDQRESGRDPVALVEAVKAYVERVRTEAEVVPSPRDRDQLRANLRFWATFLYDRTGLYPNTNLLPARRVQGARPEAVSPPSPLEAIRRLPLFRRLFIGLGVIIVLAVILLVTYVGLLKPRSQASLATNTAVAISVQQTDEAAKLPPTSTPTVPPTQTSVPTSTQVVSKPSTSTPTTGVDPRTATVAALLTQAAEAQETVLPTQAATSQDALIPVTGGGGPLYKTRPILVAQVAAQPHPDGCSVGEIRVDFDLTPVDGLELPLWIISGDLRVIIDSTGAQPSLPAAGFLKSQAGYLIPLGRVTRDLPYLVHVEHPLLTADDVIVQFSPDCQDNLVQIVYHWQEIASFVDREPLRSEDLTLGWELVTWGPAPQIDFENLDEKWVAQLNLKAEGGNGSYVFFRYDIDRFLPMDQAQVLVAGYGSCGRAVLLVGVSSGGRSVTREIQLVPPTCIEISTLPPSETETPSIGK